MKTRTTVIATVAVAIIIMIIVYAVNEYKQQADNNVSNENVKQEQQSEQKVSIKEKAQAIINVMDKRDMESLSKYVHSEKGLLFSPYAFVNEDSIIIQRNKIKTLLDDPTSYLWGHFDGSGMPIQLTPKEYFDKFLNVKPFQNPDTILVDDIKQRGNSLNNIKEVFPQSKVVEFYLSGTKEHEGMDWSSIYLVFEQEQDGEWNLVAIVKDQWTI